MRVFTYLILLTISVTSQAQETGTLHDEREVHLADVQQMTFGGGNAEAYWSPDGTEGLDGFPMFSPDGQIWIHSLGSERLARTTRKRTTS